METSLIETPSLLFNDIVLSSDEDVVFIVLEHARS